MKSRIHARKKSTKEQASDFSTAPAQPMFQSRSFVVQPKSEETSQQQDLRTSLRRAERYGHHLGRMHPTAVSAPALVQPLMRLGNSLHKSELTSPPIKELPRGADPPPIQRAIGGDMPPQQNTFPTRELEETIRPPHAQGDKSVEFKALLHYAYGKSINNRGQTFEDAVNEYKKLYPQAQETREITRLWNEVGKMLADQKVGDARQTLAQIKNKINQKQINDTAHPNKKGVQPDQESAASVPQSEQSREIAFLLRAHFADNQNWNVNTYSQDWKDRFMLGVLVVPNGDVIVSHSGKMPPAQETWFKNHVLAQVRVQGQGQVRVGSWDQQKQGEWRNALQRRLPIQGGNPRVIQQGDDRGKVEDTTTGEKGNPPGVCAAPKVLQIVAPDELRGTKPMSLTEAYVNDKPGGPQVMNAAGNNVRYQGNQDVPSCLTCQYQLDEWIIGLRRQQNRVDGLASLRSDQLEAEVNQAITEAKQLNNQLKQRIQTPTQARGRGRGRSNNTLNEQIIQWSQNVTTVIQDITQETNRYAELLAQKGSQWDNESAPKGVDTARADNLEQQKRKIIMQRQNLVQQLNTLIVQGQQI